MLDSQTVPCFATGSVSQDFLEQVPIILRELLYRLNDDNQEVLKATNAAFAALSKHVEAEELVKHIEFMRNLLNSMVSDARRRKGGVGDGEFLLPGFNMPKGRCSASFFCACLLLEVAQHEDKAPLTRPIAP